MCSFPSTRRSFFFLLLLLTMNPTVDFGKPTSFDTALIISYLLHLLGWLFALHIARVLPLKLNGNWISYEPHVNSSTPPKKRKANFVLKLLQFWHCVIEELYLPHSSFCITSEAQSLKTKKCVTVYILTVWTVLAWNTVFSWMFEIPSLHSCKKKKSLSDCKIVDLTHSHLFRKGFWRELG